MTTDEEAEAFLDQDLSDLDFSQFVPTRFEFEAKDATVTMRLSQRLLQTIKAQAEARGMPYQRYIRQVLEQAAEQQGRQGNRTD
jgi:predicted DNA binding CopG/RHH family protein